MQKYSTEYFLFFLSLIFTHGVQKFLAFCVGASRKTYGESGAEASNHLLNHPKPSKKKTQHNKKLLAERGFVADEPPQINRRGWLETWKSRLQPRHREPFNTLPVSGLAPRPRLCGPGSAACWHNTSLTHSFHNTDLRFYLQGRPTIKQKAFGFHTHWGGHLRIGTFQSLLSLLFLTTSQFIKVQ